MANSIIETSKGFEVRVLIQDGTEYCGAYSTVEEAIQYYRESQYFLNGDRYPRVPQVQYLADKTNCCRCSSKKADLSNDDAWRTVYSWCQGHLDHYGPLVELLQIAAHQINNG